MGAMRYRRFMLGFLLVSILFFLMCYSSLEHDNKDPDMDYILENFENYNNTMVSFGGKVEVLDESGQEVTVRLSEPPYLSINAGTEDIKEKLQDGDIVEILGILDGKNHVTAEAVLVSEQWKNDLIYIRSIPAIPFALYIFFRRWKFNRKTFRFERRVRDA